MEMLEAVVLGVRVDDLVDRPALQARVAATRAPAKRPLAAPAEPRKAARLSDPVDLTEDSGVRSQSPGHRATSTPQAQQGLQGVRRPAAPVPDLSTSGPQPSSAATRPVPRPLPKTEATTPSRAMDLLRSEMKAADADAARQKAEAEKAEEERKRLAGKAAAEERKRAEKAAAERKRAAEQAAEEKKRAAEQAAAEERKREEKRALEQAEARARAAEVAERRRSGEEPAGEPSPEKADSGLGGAKEFIGRRLETPKTAQASS